MSRFDLDWYFVIKFIIIAVINSIDEQLIFNCFDLNSYFIIKFIIIIIIINSIWFIIITNEELIFDCFSLNTYFIIE